MKNTPNHSVLKTQDLCIGYRHKKNTAVIASDISMDLQKGELVALVGANGIGKSTLLRTLTKVQPALSGSISINGIALETLSDSALAKVLSLVLTEGVPSKNLSVVELVALGRQPYTNWIGNLSPDDMNRVNWALEQTHTSDLRHKKCYELSDGQLQKVMIARALAQNTDLIVLDEPTTHLDMYHKAYILTFLQQLARNTSKTILFSSHEIDLAIQLCDKMIVMTDSKVVMDAPCNLIEQNVFNELFPKDLIVFDKHTGRFKVQQP